MARCRATDNTLHQRRAQPRAAKARKGGGARWMRGYGRIAGTRRPTDPTMWVCERQGQPMKALHCDVHEVGCKSRRCIRRNYRNPHTGMEKGSSGRSRVVPQQWLSPRKSTPTGVPTCSCWSTCPFRRHTGGGRTCFSTSAKSGELTCGGPQRFAVSSGAATV